MANCFDKRVSFQGAKTGSGGGRGIVAEHHHSKARQSVEALRDAGMPPGDKSLSERALRPSSRRRVRPEQEESAFRLREKWNLCPPAAAEISPRAGSRGLPRAFAPAALAD